MDTLEIWSNYSSHKSKNPKKLDYKTIKHKYDESYNEIRNHVLETPESKDQCVAQVIGNLVKKKININVKKILTIIYTNGSYIIRYYRRTR